eukprot:6193254-Pleurochrysis_carterae.AAC.3
MQRGSVNEGNALRKVGKRTTARKSRKSGRLSNLVEVLRGREKTGERDGAGGVCARASAATVYACPAGKLLKYSLRYFALANALLWTLPVLTSDCHALRHVADCRFSAPGNLHRDLYLTAGRAAALARAQSLGYYDPLAALRCPCIAGCELICATEKVRTDKALTMFCLLRLPLRPLL